MIVIADARLSTRRRRCSKCELEKDSATDFYVDAWRDREMTVAKRLRARCRECHKQGTTSRRAQALKDPVEGKRRIEHRRAYERERYHAQRTRAPQVVEIDSPFEEISEACRAGQGGPGPCIPIPAHVARAWSEEMPAVTEFKSGWWR